MNPTRSGSRTATASGDAARPSDDLAVRDQQPALLELGVQPRVEEGLETLLEDAVDLAVERSVPGVDESAGVAVGRA